MTVATLPMPDTASPQIQSIDHIICCDEDRAMCGENVSGEIMIRSTPAYKMCIVCLDLEGQPCERCSL